MSQFSTAISVSLYADLEDLTAIIVFNVSAANLPLMMSIDIHNIPIIINTNERSSRETMCLSGHRRRASTEGIQIQMNISP